MKASFLSLLARLGRISLKKMPYLMWQVTFRRMTLVRENGSESLALLGMFRNGVSAKALTSMHP